jgi:hypothetical protein
VQYQHENTSGALGSPWDLKAAGITSSEAPCTRVHGLAQTEPDRDVVEHGRMHITLWRQ